MDSNSLHSTTNMTMFMPLFRWESHLSLKTETIKTIWLTHTTHTNTKMIMEITLNTNLHKHRKEISEITLKWVDLKKSLQKKILLKLLHQLIIKVVSVAKDGKMDLNFHHLTTNTMSHIKWENPWFLKTGMTKMISFLDITQENIKILKEIIEFIILEHLMKIHFVGDLNSSKNKASNGYEITDKYVASFKC